MSVPNPTPTLDRPNHWGALLMALFLLSNAALLFAAAPILLVLGLGPQAAVTLGEPLTLLMLAMGFLTVGTLLTPAIYLNLRAVFNVPQPSFRFPKIPTAPAVTTLAILWVFTILAGQIAAAQRLAQLILLPILNIIAVLLPVAAALFISLHKLPLPSARRTWSIFGASTILSTTLALLLEIAAFAIFLALAILYASSTPGLNTSLQTILTDLQTQNIKSFDFLSADLAALLLAPGTTLALVGLLSLAVPLIEEAAKVSLLWFYAGRLQTPIEGFVLGIVCGAAFALTENIGFSSSSSADWAASLLTRATATLPHIFNSGMMGLALAYAWQKKSYLRLFFTYLAAVLIHGSWNALSIALAFSSLNSISPATNPPTVVQTPLPAVITWGILILGLIGGLFLANHQMRKLAAA